MAITAVQRLAKGANAASVSIGAGDGWTTPVAGNLIVATANSDNTVTMTTSGFTAGPAVVDGNGAYMWFKVAAGTESTITITPASSAKTVLTVAEYAGVASSPFDAQTSSTIAGSGGTVTTSASLSTSADGDLVVAAALLHQYGVVIPSGPSWSNGFTNQLTADSGGTTVTDAETFYTDLVVGAAGSYSTVASWSNAANDRQHIIMAFKAAADPGVGFAPYTTWPGAGPWGAERFQPDPRSADPPVTLTPTADVPADQANTGYVGNDAAADVDPNSDTATAAFTAYDQAADIGPTADPAAVALTAYDPTTAAAANADQGTVAFTAADGVTSAGPNSEMATATLTAYDATVSTATAAAAPADAATLTLTAADAAPAVGPQADGAAVTVAGQDATAAITAGSGSGLVGFTAADATVSTTTATSPAAEAGLVTLTAQDPATAVAGFADTGTYSLTGQGAATAAGSNAEAASVGFTAYDATVSTLSATQATADQTDTTYAAQGPTVAAEVPGAPATTTAFTSYGPAAAAGVNSDQATVTYVSQPANVSAGVPADSALTTGYAAQEATTATAVSPPADVAAPAFTAYDAAISTLALTNVDAGPGLAAFTAYDATITTTTAVGADTSLTGYTSPQATTAAGTQGAIATASLTAADATTQTGRIVGPETAPAVFTAWDTGVTVSTPGLVAGFMFAGLDATIQTASNVRAFSDVEASTEIRDQRESVAGTSAGRDSAVTVSGFGGRRPRSQRSVPGRPRSPGAGVTPPRKRPSGRSGTGNARYRANREALLAQSNVCGICGHPGAKTADHKIPDPQWPRDPVTGKRHHGFDEIGNLMPAHGTMGPFQPENRCPTCGRLCNQSKGARVARRPQTRDWFPGRDPR